MDLQKLKPNKSLKMLVKYDDIEFDCELTQINEDDFEIYAKDHCTCYHYMDKLSLSSLKSLNENFHDYKTLNDLFATIELLNKHEKLKVTEVSNECPFLKFYFSNDVVHPITQVKTSKEFEIKVAKVEVKPSELNIIEQFENIKRELKECRKNSELQVQKMENLFKLQKMRWNRTLTICLMTQKLDYKIWKRC